MARGAMRWLRPPVILASFSTTATLLFCLSLRMWFRSVVFPAGAGRPARECGRVSLTPRRSRDGRSLPLPAPGRPRGLLAARNGGPGRQRSVWGHGAQPHLTPGSPSPCEEQRKALIRWGRGYTAGGCRLSGRAAAKHRPAAWHRPSAPLAAPPSGSQRDWNLLVLRLRHVGRAPPGWPVWELRLAGVGAGRGSRRVVGAAAKVHTLSEQVTECWKVAFSAQNHSWVGLIPRERSVGYLP